MRIEVCKSVRKTFWAAMFGLASLALVQTVFAQAQTVVTEGSAKQTSSATNKETGKDVVQVVAGTVSQPAKSEAVWVSGSATGTTTGDRSIKVYRSREAGGGTLTLYNGEGGATYCSGTATLDEMPLKEALGIAISSAPSDKDLPKVEQLVERTLAINPEVVAARAELQRAQANLNRVQLQIAQNVIALRAHWEVARREVGFLEAKLKEAGDDKAKEEITRAYIRARAELSQIERQLPILSGGLEAKVVTFTPGGYAYLPEAISHTGLVTQASTAADVCTVQAKNANVFTGSVVSAVGEIKAPKELEMPVTMEFQNTPLRDVADYLHDFTKLNFVFDPGAEMGDREVTLQFKDMPLKAVLQAIEDTTWPVRFLVRPYGILVTDTSSRFGN